MTDPLPRLLTVAALAEYQARRQRTAALRAELAECRRIGKERRHAERLRRATAARDTTTKGKP